MRLHALLPLLLCVACGGGDDTVEAGRWQDLSAGPAAVLGQAPLTFGDAGVTLTAEGGSWRVRAVVPSAGFEDLGGGLFRAARPLPSAGEATFTLAGAELPEIELHVGRQREAPALARVDPPQGALRWLARQARPGAIAIGPWVYLALEPGAPVPGELTVETGVDAGEGGRLVLSGLTASGFRVPPGGHVARSATAPAGSVLRFQLLVTGRLEGGSMSLVLEDGGEELGRWERPLDGSDTPVPVAIALPAGARELRFRAEGDAALVAVLTPRVAPAEVGRPDARPWDEPRRDVVLLMADTYRADNLAAWGGDPVIAPRLNQLAAEGRRFLDVRAPSTWTLPSHAAFLSGLYPPQCGVALEMDRLPESAWTLAEHLAAAGYRTAAVTDRGYVSQAFGMDQGFEWFAEGEVDVDRTVSEVERVLAADDGRPLFLFVQSYRAHDPYRCEPRTRERLGEAYAPKHELEELLGKLGKAARDEQRGEGWSGAAGALARDYERYYRGASADLDACFGVLLDRFDEGGLRDNTVMCLTSDHGESFADHGVMGHGSGVWDDQALVPFVLRAPGLEPGDTRHPGSLIDLPRTLSLLAGVEDHGDWLGQDLLDPSGTPPVFSFQTREVMGATDVAVVHRGLKLILDAQRGDEVRYGYDLTGDPSESVDRGQEDEFRELRESVDRALRAVRSPLLGREDSEISADHRANLDALGYGGGEDEE